MDQQRIEELIKKTQIEAAKSIKKGDSPFGCVITDQNGKIVARGHNTVNSETDTTAHAEIKALRSLSKKLKSRYLENYIVFANASSCAMCITAAIKANITRFYFGAPSEPGMNPGMTGEEVAATAVTKISITSGILAEECKRQIEEGRKKA